MSEASAPWHGVHVATALPFHDDDELSVDYEGYAAHVRFPAEHGWDSKTEFGQATKTSMDLAGPRGGPCRPPRSPLTGEAAARVVRETETGLALGHR